MKRRGTVNEHVGLRADEHKRRYRRWIELEGRDAIDTHDGWENDSHDGYWNARDSRDGDDYVLFKAFEMRALDAAIQPKLEDLFTTASPSPAERAVAVPQRLDPDDLPPALFAHIKSLVSRSDALELLQREYAERALAQLRDISGLREIVRRFSENAAPFAMALLFMPFWVRPIGEWSPPSADDGDVLVDSLLAHLFELYPVPKPLYQPWHQDSLPSLKWVCWLIMFGQGASLYRAARVFGWTIHRRFEQYFATAPAELSPFDACMWAEIQRLGGSRVELDRFRRDPAYAVDPTESARSMSTRYSWPDEPPWGQDEERLDRTAVFWRQTVEWLIRHRDALTDERCDAILPWAMHLHTEDLRNDRGTFSWSRRSPAAAYEAALDYRRRLDGPNQSLVWVARGWDSNAEPPWTIVELTTGQQLHEETKAMHHCVTTYAYRCARGESAIFSLRHDGERRLTIEIAPHSRRVVQARGPRNAAPKVDEQALIGRWLETLSALEKPSI